MGLLFNAINERVQVTQNASINGLTTGTIWCWVYVNTLDDQMPLIVKLTTSPWQNDYSFIIDSAVGSLDFTIKRATTTLTMNNEADLLTEGE